MRIRPHEFETSICDVKYHVSLVGNIVMFCVLNSFLVDWAVKMRIRPHEFETSICDVKYHVSLVKWVYLFDLQDVCMIVGSLATLDLPMVVDLIGIFVLKEPYCMLTMTDWFLQALSVIPRGSWGDVSRSFTMIRWVSPKMWFRSHKCSEPTASCIPEPLRVTQPATGYTVACDWYIVACDWLFRVWISCSLRLAKRCRIHLSKRHRFAIANFKYHRLVLLYLTADYDDITADVIIADPLLRFLSTADCDDITADVIIAALSFLQ
ncbi:hypothetical protein F511_20691 [Dorcoceras hygrometricum]|uniref:Uncharacterized protein n=1 Tax=Dorcoceras hygrometricum TaxID=472368 RepID=A0A2Z7CT12_9LAMI|nr:hypothetical protein F511_20691 [Dorcoceras hygrometricum]